MWIDDSILLVIQNFYPYFKFHFKSFMSSSKFNLTLVFHEWFCFVFQKSLCFDRKINLCSSKWISNSILISDLIRMYGRNWILVIGKISSIFFPLQGNKLSIWLTKLVASSVQQKHTHISEKKNTQFALLLWIILNIYLTYFRSWKMWVLLESSSSRKHLSFLSAQIIFFYWMNSCYSQICYRYTLISNQKLKWRETYFPGCFLTLPCKYWIHR